jgi:quinol monooxygenase YgiN
MAATVHVVARFIAKSGKEEALRAVLYGAVAPTRRELACYQYDLLANPQNPREFCFVERWENEKSLDQHLETPHIVSMMAQVQDLVDGPPDIRRYRIL